MSDLKTQIVEVTVATARAAGLANVTLDLISHAVPCSKGLVTYHFGSKARLVAESVAHIYAQREAGWQRKLDGADIGNTINRSWEMLIAEHGDGTLPLVLAAFVAPDEEVVRSAADGHTRFCRAIADRVVRLLRDSGLRSTIRSDHLGNLLASLVSGSTVSLVAGAEPDEVREAYAAGWLGVLRLTATVTAGA